MRARGPRGWGGKPVLSSFLALFSYYFFYRNGPTGGTKWPRDGKSKLFKRLHKHFLIKHLVVDITSHFINHTFINFFQGKRPKNGPKWRRRRKVSSLNISSFFLFCSAASTFYCPDTLYHPFINYSFFVFQRRRRGKER